MSMFLPLMQLMAMTGAADVSGPMSGFGDIAKRMSGHLFELGKQRGHRNGHRQQPPIGGAAANLTGLLGSMPSYNPSKPAPVTPPPGNSGYAIQGQSAAKRRQTGSAPIPSPKAVPLPQAPQTRFVQFLTKSNQALQKFIQPVTKLTTSFGRMVSGSAIGKAASTAGSGIASVFGNILKGGGDIMGAIKIVGAMGAALVATPILLKEFAGLLVESNRSLALWDGRLAASFAELDILQTQLDIKTAQGTATSGSMLNEEFGKLLKEMQPMRQDISNLLNITGVAVISGLRDMMFIFEAVIKTVDQMPIIGGNIMKALDALRNKDKLNLGDDLLVNWMRSIKAGLRANPNPQQPLPPPIGPRGNLPPVINPFGLPPARPRRRGN